MASAKYSFVLLSLVILVSCEDDEMGDMEVFDPTPYQLVLPTVLEPFEPLMKIPDDNPLTVEGVALGRKLFFETRLSADGTLSCAGCHIPDKSFAENKQFSTGIDGIEGTRNAQNIVNLSWMNSLFWDGRAESIEKQALEPVVNPIEMHNSWSDVENELMSDDEYRQLFKAAFGTENIDSILVVKAIAQFERTLISGNSAFDRYLNEEPTGWKQEDFDAALRGLDVFMAEEKGDCFHCHGDPTNPFWTDNLFHNNGLDATFSDLGLGAITGSESDNGKFKTPTLRNLLFTAPYMHDGRFNSLEEVVDHYSTGLKNSPTIDPLMKKIDQGGAQLSPQDKSDLIMFMKSLTDSSFVNNPNFQDPE